MNLRPKTKRRLLALTAGGVVLGAAASVLIYVQLNREETRQRELRADGIGAYQRGDYATAIDDFKQYLSSDHVDTESLYAYAVSRSKVPLPDLGHLREAKSLFTRYLELNPGDPEAQHKLLDIYRRLNYTAETDVLANALLAQNPDDVPALVARLQILAGQTKYLDALRISRRINELTPLDLRTQEITYDLMLRCNHPPADLIARADSMLAKHSGDPRFELLRADAAAFTGDHDGARHWLDIAAAKSMPDPQTLQMLAGALDRMGMWNEARLLLEKSAAIPSAPTAVTAAWVLRLWEAGQLDQALANLKTATTQPRADARLLGLKTMILFTRSSPGAPDPDATAALKSLDERPDDPAAASWSALLHADFVQGLNDPRQAVILCESACRQDPDNPVARFDLGRAYLRLDESELALKCLRQSSELAPGWSSPYVMIARTLLECGRITDAAGPAQAAFDRDSSSAAAQTTLAITATAQTNLTDINRLLAFVKQVYTTNPDDVRVLSAYADLLARTGHRQEATDLIVDAIGGPTITAAGLCSLQNVSDTNRLDLSDAINDRAARHSPTTPQELCDQVRLFTAAGRAVDAHRAIRTAGGQSTPAWKLAILQSRELLGDPDLAPAWAALADAQPADLSIQHGAINSPAAWTNRSLIDRVIIRCKALTGNDAVQWRLARARWQLESRDDLKRNAAAVATAMAEVVAVVPQMLQPHLLWAEALQLLGEPDSAIIHMRAAQSIARTPTVNVELARLLALQGQYHEAVALVESVMESPGLSPGTRDRAVRILCQAGEPSKAIELLENIPGDHSIDQDILLAHIYADQGNDIPASHVYSRLMQVPTPSNPVVRAVAWFQASRGNLAEGRDTLKRLDPAQAIPGEIQLTVADFEAAFGDKQAAGTAYQAATDESPTNPQTWLSFAGFNLRARDYARAISTADKGLTWCSGDANLVAVGSRARSLKALSPGSDAQPLIDALSTEPSNSDAVAALNELTTSQATHKTPEQLLNRLSAFAQQNPRFLPVHLMLATRYLEAGLYDDAVLIASRATGTFPAAIDPARLLTRINFTAGRWQAGLAAAAEWRSRSLARPQPADNAIATAQEHLDHPELATQVLSPYLTRSLPAVAASPEVPCDDSTTVALCARALAMQHRFAEMQTMLSPLSGQSVTWRRQCLQIIADTAPDTPVAIAQMSQIEALMPSGSVDDRVALADARYTAGTRLQDAGLLQRSLDVLDSLTDAGAAPVDVWMLLGAIHQQMNQPANAEAAYRKALAISPAMPLAQNNLAMLILLRKGDLNEARKLAEQAVSAEPGNSTLHGTLGEIEAQTNDLDAARAQLETAIRLDPQNAAALVSLADTQCRAAQMDKALDTLRRVDNVGQITHKPLEPAVRQQLDRIREACKRALAVG